MKMISGWLAILLGVVGVIACVVGSIAVWWIAFEVAERADQFTSEAEESLKTVNDALTRVDEKVGLATTTVERIRETAKRIAAGKAEDDPQTRSELTRLLNTLTPHLDRAEALADPMQTLAAFLRRFADTLGKRAEGERQAAEFRSIADAMDFAISTLGTVRTRTEALRLGEAAPRANELVAIAEQAQAPLDRMNQGITELQRKVSRVREELPEVREAVQVWKIAGPVLTNLILFWIALGQLCLIGWGRRQLARPHTA